MLQAALLGPARRDGARDGRRRRGRDEAPRGGGRRRPRRGPARDWPARSRRQPGEGRALRRRSELGPDPGHPGRAGGRRELPLDPSRRALHAGHHGVRQRRPVDFDAENLRSRMREAEIDVLVELADGDDPARRLGCDLSYDYVKINADYTSLSARSRTGARRSAAPIGTQAGAARRGAEVHSQLLRQARRHQVRRRGDGEGEPQARVRRGRLAPAGRPA